MADFLDEFWKIARSHGKAYSGTAPKPKAQQEDCVPQEMTVESLAKLLNKGFEAGKPIRLKLGAETFLIDVIDKPLTNLG